MKVAPKIFFLSILALALCGFSSKFSIKVSQVDGSAPSFDLRKKDFLHASSGVEINTFLVVKKNASGEWDYKDPIWAFKVEPGSAKPLSIVMYGSLPNGFSETAKASNLVGGTRYLVVGLGPGSSGSVEFVDK